MYTYIYIYIKICTHKPNPFKYCTWSQAAPHGHPASQGWGMSLTMVDEEKKSWSMTEFRILKKQTCPSLSQTCTGQIPCSWALRPLTEPCQALLDLAWAATILKKVTQGVLDSPSATKLSKQRKPQSNAAGFVLVTGQLMDCWRVIISLFGECQINKTLPGKRDHIGQSWSRAS